MKTILITGIDGTGKSTLLNLIENSSLGANSAFLRLPQIELKNLQKHTILYNTACFVNELGIYADKNKSVALKAIALFSAMLLFKDLQAVEEKNYPSIVFCERHPLIDTVVYAEFYAEKLAQKPQKEALNENFSTKYFAEIEYLLQKLPVGYVNEKNSFFTFIQFIIVWFFQEKKTDFPSLEKLFGVTVPDKIFYLTASAEILYKRVNNRELKEAHETPETFKIMSKIYDTIFEKLNTEMPNFVTYMNTNNLDEIKTHLQTIEKECKTIIIQPSK